MKKYILYVLLILFPSLLAAQQIEGTWYGVMNIQGTELPLEMTISKNGKNYQSNLKSPSQSEQRINMDKTTYKKKVITIQSELLRFVFTGNHHKDSLVGVITQNGAVFPITLYASNKYLKPLKRPQTPNEPYDYESRIIQFTNAKDNTTLEGTLTMPKSKPSALVIFVSGSGQQDRDNTIDGHKSFLVMSDYFTTNGIATFRYDDRGFGNSKGDFSSATTNDFANDTRAAIATLKNMDALKDIPIGLIGHSEGGLIAYMIAADEKPLIDFIVSLAGPTVIGKDLLLTQQRKIGEGMGAKPIVTEQNILMNETIYNTIITHPNDQKRLNHVIDSIGNITYAVIENEIKSSYPSAQSFIDFIHASYARPWIQQFIALDPAKYIAAINIPGMLIFGGKDVQVDADRNIEALQHALIEQPQHKLMINNKINLNHLMQSAITGLPDEYGKIEETIEINLMNEILEFVSQQNTNH